MKDIDTNQQSISVQWNKTTLPPHLQALASTLHQARSEVLSFTEQADRKFLNFFGYDAALTLIPVVGALYSASGGFYLISKSIKSRCGFGTIAFGSLIVLIDVIVGAFIGFGDIVDIVFRSHNIFGNRIVDEIDRKLQLLATYHYANPKQLNSDDLSQLEDNLFRNGKTQTEALVKSALIGIVALFVLHSCFEHQKLRSQHIADCKARGEWFCSFKY